MRDGRVVLDADETRHIRRVLRLRVGDVVRAMDGLGHEWTVRLTALGTRAEGDILEAGAPAPESPLHLTLAQGLPKGDKLDTVVRMSTELGVAAIVPLLSARSVSRAEAGAARRARWERVAREAAKQCGRAVVPTVAAPSSLSDWLATRDPSGLLVCLWEREPTPAAGAAARPRAGASGRGGRSRGRARRRRGGRLCGRGRDRGGARSPAPQDGDGGPGGRRAASGSVGRSRAAPRERA